jgi:putative tryptophan/tyrosine transport system substrate-binding protein
VSRSPEVIVSNLNGLVKTFTTTTTSIPIVGITGDPIAAGLVTSLAHPGGNLTGVSIDAGMEIVTKRLQILQEAMPRAAKVAYLLSNAWDDRTGLSYREAGQHFGIALTGNFLPEINDAQLRRVFDELTLQQFDAASSTRAAAFHFWLTRQSIGLVFRNCKFCLSPLARNLERTSCLILIDVTP